MNALRTRTASDTVSAPPPELVDSRFEPPDGSSGLTTPTVLDDAPVQAEASRKVDRLLHDNSLRLRFPKDLEARFHQDRAADRLRTILISGLLVAIFYNVMLISDRTMVPDVFDQAVRLRVFVYTPITIIGLFLVTKLPNPHWREHTIIASALGAGGITAYLCVRSTDELAGPYLEALLTVVMFSNSVVQMRFVHALVLDLLLLGMYGVAQSMIQVPQPAALTVPQTLALVAGTVFTLYACYTRERDERRSWLLRLRETLLLKELERANQDMAALSRSDMLTGVANRRHLDEHLDHVWARARKDHTNIALLMIDVDHFKAYNDRYGHLEGDECLRDVAEVLKRRLRRPNDLVARFGGEEFVAVLAGTPLATAAAAAERVRKAVENLNRLHATSTTHAVVTVSIGVASANPAEPHTTPGRLLAAADAALYAAKAGGRNRVLTEGDA